MTFGSLVKTKRLEAGYSLRKFCEIAEIDSSNWSKVERDRLPVSYDREKLESIAKLIKLEDGSKEWFQFFDLASLSQKKIPEDIYSDDEVVKALPIFFRTLRGDKPDKKELDKMIELLKRR
jgi:transcriptional regulator with XRE-family HTH domain